MFMFLNRREANLYFNLDELFISQSKAIINRAYNKLACNKKKKKKIKKK